MSHLLLSIYPGEITGWACALGEEVSSGWINWRTYSTSKKFCDQSVNLWLSGVRSDYPLWAAVALHHVAGVPPDAIEEIHKQAELSRTRVRTISPKSLKQRCNALHYATRRDVLNWSIRAFPQEQVERFEQAAALAGLRHVQQETFEG